MQPLTTPPPDARLIPGFSSYYLTPRGEVYSQFRQRFLKPALMSESYYGLILIGSDGTKKRLCLPQVVGEMFVPNPEQLRFAIPRDGNPHHYHAENLIWANSFSPPNPPASVVPGEQRRATSIKQLMTLWQRFEELLKRPAILSIVPAHGKSTLMCSLTASKARALKIHLRSKTAVAELLTLLDVPYKAIIPALPATSKTKPIAQSTYLTFAQFTSVHQAAITLLTANTLVDWGAMSSLSTPSRCLTA